MELELPPELPEATIRYYRRHYRTKVLTKQEILDQVREYVQVVKDRQDAFHDIELCQRIGDNVCLLAESAEADVLRHVQAAALYLIDEDDAEDDDSPFGFDDDRQVFNAVCLYLNRADLVVEL